MDEVADDRVRTATAHLLADEIEVVVLQQHDGSPAPRLDLVADGVGELLVDGDVARGEGMMRLGVDDRILCEAVQPVLDEPQQRVGDLRVEHRMTVRVDFDVPHVDARPGVVGVRFDQRRAGVERDLDRLPFVLGCDVGVGTRRSRADPHGVVEMLGQAHQCGDQSTGAAFDGEAGAGPLKLSGTSV